MSAPPPILLTYLGKGRFKVPSDHWANLADRHYGEGEVVRMVPDEQRSTATHNHYFACVADAHANLPDELAVQFPKPEHLRRYALIRTGYCTSHAITLDTAEEARRVYAFAKPMDEFSVVSLKGCVVTRFTAQSQSHKAMNKQTFAKSKEDVLAYISTMVGTTAKALEDNTGQSGEGRR